MSEEKCKCGWAKDRHGPSGQCPTMRNEGLEVMARIIQQNFWAIYCYDGDNKFTPQPEAKQ